MKSQIPMCDETHIDQVNRWQIAKSRSGEKKGMVHMRMMMRMRMMMVDDIRVKVTVMIDTASRTQGELPTKDQKWRDTAQSCRLRCF